jgi:ribosome biogenesis GTPase
MTLADLGLAPEYLTDHMSGFLKDYSLGRVMQEHRERYIVTNGENEYEAEITGNLRFTASSREDFPAVGDWVAMTVYDEDQAIIHKILPRKSLLQRHSAGKTAGKQVIAANVDSAFIVQSVDNNFNLNRLERYLTICHSAHVDPIVIISKIDLAGEGETGKAITKLKRRHAEVKYFLLSNITLQGLDDLSGILCKGRTYCVLGSSGVGKSSLINNLLKRNILLTGEISRSSNKGKHTTDHRELFILDNGAIIIDNPGMRELGITDDDEGIRTTYQEIFELSLKCRFPDCRHRNEIGCAVLEAVRNGIIDNGSLENFRKITREQAFYNSTVAEKREKDRKFGTMCKNIMIEKRKNKF